MPGAQDGAGRSLNVSTFFGGEMSMAYAYCFCFFSSSAQQVVKNVDVFFCHRSDVTLVSLADEHSLIYLCRVLTLILWDLNP